MAIDYGCDLLWPVAFSVGQSAQGKGLWIEAGCKAVVRLEVNQNELGPGVNWESVWTRSDLGGGGARSARADARLCTSSGINLIVPLSFHLVR